MGSTLLFERDPGAFREAFDSLGKTEVLVFLHEGEDVATLLAPKAVKNLTLRIHVKTGRLLLVKGAECHKAHAGTLEREVGADHFHNITRGAHLLAEAFGEHGRNNRKHFCKWINRRVHKRRAVSPEPLLHLGTASSEATLPPVAIGARFRM